MSVTERERSSGIQGGDGFIFCPSGDDCSVCYGQANRERERSPMAVRDRGVPAMPTRTNRAHAEVW